MAETKPISTTDPDAKPPRAGTRTEGETAPTGPPEPTPTQAEADALRLGDAGLEPPPPPPEGAPVAVREEYEAAKKEYDEREKNLPPAAKEAREKRRKEIKDAEERHKERMGRRDYGGRGGPTPTPYENR